jgi:hypothetical protein
MTWRNPGHVVSGSRKHGHASGRWPSGNGVARGPSGPAPRPLDIVAQRSMSCTMQRMETWVKPMSPFRGTIRPSGPSSGLQNAQGTQYSAASRSQPDRFQSALLLARHSVGRRVRPSGRSALRSAPSGERARANGRGYAGRFRRQSSLRALPTSSITSTKRVLPPQLEPRSGRCRRHPLVKAGPGEAP